MSPVDALSLLVSDERIAIVGTPRLTHHRVLDNKRQVLVRDACDSFALWDVTTGTCCELPPPPAAPKEEPGCSGSLGGAEEVMKCAFALVNRPVSVPSWFSCDIALGSLSVYLDVAQCFRAEPDEVDVAPVLGAGGAVKCALPPGSAEVNGVINMGAQTLRALFDSWVRTPPPPLTVSGGRSPERVASRSQSPSTQSSSRGRNSQQVVKPRFFAAPAGLSEDRRRGDGSSESVPTAATPQGGSAASFPPATALVMVSRSGRPVGYRGRLYCGYFNASESPDLLPPWVVDVVWNQRPPPEEHCGERSLAFSLARCTTEFSLPLLVCPFCIALPRTRVRSLMIRLVRTLDFDWSSPSKAPVVRRPSSAVSLVSRLGRCCVAPGGGRGTARSSSSDSWDDSERGDSPRHQRSRAEGGGSVGSGGSRTRGSRGGSRQRRRSRDRVDVPDHTTRSGANGSSSSVGGRRGFHLRGRGEDDGTVGAVVRVRTDLRPEPLTSNPAGAASSPRKLATGQPAAAPNLAAGKGASVSGARLSLDERCVEILCNGVVCDPDISLATVRDFLWKKPGVELLLHYRRALGLSGLLRPPSSLSSPGGKEVPFASPRPGEDPSDFAATCGGTAWGTPQGETPCPSPGEGMRSPTTAPKE